MSEMFNAFFRTKNFISTQWIRPKSISVFLDRAIKAYEKTEHAELNTHLEILPTKRKSDCFVFRAVYTFFTLNLGYAFQKKNK